VVDLVSSEDLPTISPLGEDDDEDLPEQRAQSSFRGGTAVTAAAHIRHPTSSQPNPKLLPIKVAIGTFSDVSVAHESIAYNLREVTEEIRTGAGRSTFQYEGTVDMAVTHNTFHPIPALIASDKNHLPKDCTLLIGASQINELNLSVDTLRLSQGQPLTYPNYNTPLECHMGEKAYAAWWEKNADKPVSQIPHAYTDIDINPDLPPDDIQRLTELHREFAVVFDVNKRELPPPAHHPPVELKFKKDWKHVHCPQPRWGPASRKVLTRWAQEGLDSGLYETSTSPSASRTHVISKYSSSQPKSTPIEE